jgi:uncharacterized protein YjbJ (UPF0337 family)
MLQVEIKENWTVIKERLREKWPILTDNDLHYAGGRNDALLTRIQQRTGETREAVEKELTEIVAR